MNDYLYCPICERQMAYKLEPQLSYGHYIAPDRHWFTCDKDHERVLVSIEDNQLHHTFVYLGDGCYVFGDFDNTSCEKAIARMRREYDWNTGFTNGV